MAGIAVVQGASGQMEHTDEEGDEHVGLVEVGDGAVHGHHDAMGHGLMG